MERSSTCELVGRRGGSSWHQGAAQLRQTRITACRRSAHEQTRSRENFVICSTAVDGVWREMTGRNMQRVAIREPNMRSLRFRLTDREQLASPARQRDVLEEAARLSRGRRNVRIPDRAAAGMVAASPTRGTSLLRAADGIALGSPIHDRRNRWLGGPLAANLITSMGGADHGR